MGTQELERNEVGEVEKVIVRSAREEDLDAVVRIDAASSKRRRPRYFQIIFDRALHHSGMQISLVAELDGRIVGFVIGSLYYGEYGVVEPSASLDAIGVDPEARRQQVGSALMRQLSANLEALGVVRMRTEVDWSDFDLLAFFKREGFAPASRLCLERRLGDSESRNGGSK